MAGRRWGLVVSVTLLLLAAALIRRPQRSPCRLRALTAPSTAPSHEPPAAVSRQFRLGATTFTNLSNGLNWDPYYRDRRCFDASNYSDHLHFTPTRAYPHSPANLRTALVLLITGPGNGPRPAASAIDRLAANRGGRWESWKAKLFHEAPNITLVMVFQLHDRLDIPAAAERLGLRPVDCATDPSAKQSCETLRGLDDGYTAYSTRTAADGPELYALLGWRNVTLGRFPIRHNMSHVRHWTLEFVMATTWYAHPMFALQILDFFDVFIKVDDSVTFYQPLPSAVLESFQPPRQPLFFHTGLYTEPLHVAAGLQSCVEMFLDLEAERCGLDVQAASAWRPFFKEKHRTYQSSFVGGWLGFFTSPEVQTFGWVWMHFSHGMWVHRWTDQQFWAQALGVFHDSSRIADFRTLRGKGFWPK